MRIGRVTTRSLGKGWSHATEGVGPLSPAAKGGVTKWGHGLCPWGSTEETWDDKKEGPP